MKKRIGPSQIFTLVTCILVCFVTIGVYIALNMRAVAARENAANTMATARAAKAWDAQTAQTIKSGDTAAKTLVHACAFASDTEAAQNQVDVALTSGITAWSNANHSVLTAEAKATPAPSPSPVAGAPSPSATPTSAATASALQSSQYTRIARGSITLIDNFPKVLAALQKLPTLPAPAKVITYTVTRGDAKQDTTPTQSGGTVPVTKAISANDVSLTLTYEVRVPTTHICSLRETQQPTIKPIGMRR